MIRAFVAIPLPAELLETVEKLQGELKETDNAFSFVKKENVHFTLKFIGSVEQGEIERIRGKLHAWSANIASFSVSLNSIGCFPSAGNARVVWIGSEEGKEKLVALMKELEQLLPYHQEKREPAAHLTIARVKELRDKEGLKKFVEKYKEKELGSFAVEKIVLFQSVLSRGGAVYTPIEEYGLKR